MTDTTLTQPTASHRVRGAVARLAVALALQAAVLAAATTAWSWPTCD